MVFFFSATFPQLDVKDFAALMKFFLYTYDLKIFMNEEVLLKVVNLRKFRAPKILHFFVCVCLSINI